MRVAPGAIARAKFIIIFNNLCSMPSTTAKKLIFLLQLLQGGRIFPRRVTAFFVWQYERSRKVCLSCSDRRVPAPDTQLLGFGGLACLSFLKRHFES